MKKTLLFVFCAAILLCANSAIAQTSALSSSSQLQGGGLITPMLGGEWSVTIIVTDIKSTPISGALVSAPCTGLASQYTDVHGYAAFSGTGACPCTKAPVNVTTAGCDKTVNVSCGSSQVICP